MLTADSDLIARSTRGSAHSKPYSCVLLCYAGLGWASMSVLGGTRLTAACTSALCESRFAEASQTALARGACCLDVGFPRVLGIYPGYQRQRCLARRACSCQPLYSPNAQVPTSLIGDEVTTYFPTYVRTHARTPPLPPPPTPGSLRSTARHFAPRRLALRYFRTVRHKRSTTTVPSPGLLYCTHPSRKPPPADTPHQRK